MPIKVMRIREEGNIICVDVTTDDNKIDGHRNTKQNKQAKKFASTHNFDEILSNDLTQTVSGKNKQITTNKQLCDKLNSIESTVASTNGSTFWRSNNNGIKMYKTKIEGGREIQEHISDIKTKLSCNSSNTTAKFSVSQMQA